MKPFGLNEWQILPDRNVFRHSSSEFKVEPKIMAVLGFLAEHQGKVCDRKSILEAVWTDVVVNDEVLTQAISKLRNLLDDTKRPHALIETVPKRGYRLVATVIYADSEELLASFSSHSLITASKQNESKQIEHVLPNTSLEAIDASKNLVSTIFDLPKFFVYLVAIGVVFAFFSALQYTKEKNSLTSGKYHLENWQTLSDDEFISSFIDISPDSQWVVLTQNLKIEEGDTANSADGFSTIFIAPVNNQNRVNETIESTPNAHFLSPAWSKSGEKLAYVRRLNGSCNIVIYNLKTKQRENAAPCEDGRFIAWHPSDKSIVYGSAASNGRSKIFYLLNLDTKVSEQITFADRDSWGDAFPVFDVKGEHLLFSRFTQNKHKGIYQYSLKSRETSLVAKVPEPINGMTLNKKQQLVFTTYHGNYYKVWLADVMSQREPKRISEGLGTLKVWPSKWQQNLVFSKLNYDIDLYTFKLQTPTEHTSRSNINSVSSDSLMTSSPNSSWSAFISSRSGHSQLWLKNNLKENTLKQITHFRGYFVGPPVWSPSSEFVYFAFRAFGKNTQLYKYSVKSGSLHSITPVGADYEAPLPLSDDVLLFSSNRGGKWKLWQLDANVGVIEEYADISASSLLLAPSNKGVLLVKRYLPGLWYLPEKGETETLLVAGVDHLQDTNNWTTTFEEIYFSSRDANNRATLYRYSWQTREVAAIADLGLLKTNSGLNVHDDRSITFSKVKSATQRLVTAALTDSP